MEQVGDEGTALGNDAHGVVEVSEEGQQLLFRAVGDVEVVGEKQGGPVQFVWGKGGLERDGVQCDAEELHCCVGAFGFLQG